MATMFGGRSGEALSRGTGMGERPSKPSASRPNRRHGVTLDRLIQGEIIPRLLSAHPAPVAVKVLAEATPAVGPIDPAEARAFALLPLELEADELLERVDAFLQRGVPVEAIFVDLLAPAARKLGQDWEDDTCDFVDVTMGLWRLQEVMRELAVRVPAVRDALTAPRSALFSPMPGEQHSFGALMMDEVFARVGWRSEALIEPRRADLLRAIAEHNFDLVGLTLSCDCPSGPLSDLIMAIRGVSKNPAVQVFIGGRVVNADPGLVSRVGADGTAPDASSALALAEQKVPEPIDFDHAGR